MSTPVKAARLLFNTVSSKVSPKTLSPLLSRDLSNTTKTLRNSRWLQIPDAKTNIRLDNKFGKEPQSESSEFLINTPNKLKLLKKGVTNEDGIISKILGKGAFGTVFKAIQNGEPPTDSALLGHIGSGCVLSVPVAVKVIKLEEKEPNRPKINESNVSNLSHKNIVTTLDVILNKFEAYGVILMEYFDRSRDLQSALSDTCFPLTDQDISRYFKDIVTGVQFCHNQGILHLDLKPKNVLLSDDGVCKICDFGNSMRITEIQENNGLNLKGTAIYTAPEILCGKRPSTKSDIYSLGVLLWQMVYRKTPYDFLDNKFVIIYKVVKYDLRPNSDVKSTKKIDPFSNIYTSCWRKLPEERPDSSEILELLSLMK